jgi:hypothetical protein
MGDRKAQGALELCGSSFDSAGCPKFFGCVPQTGSHGVNGAPHIDGACQTSGWQATGQTRFPAKTLYEERY